MEAEFLGPGCLTAVDGGAIVRLYKRLSLRET
jgi:hypothetical protein